MAPSALKDKEFYNLKNIIYLAINLKRNTREPFSAMGMTDCRVVTFRDLESLSPLYLGNLLKR